MTWFLNLLYTSLLKLSEAIWFSPGLNLCFSLILGFILNVLPELPLGKFALFLPCFTLLKCFLCFSLYFYYSFALFHPEIYADSMPEREGRLLFKEGEKGT
jgi:hypothetical protein